VFKYIQDKDIFLEFYSKLFAYRLVKETSTSDDLEQSMIVKLKEECGFEYTSKFQKMFSDISVSKTLNEEFKNKTQSDSNIDFQIKVLTTVSWPFKQGNDVHLPKELETLRNRFMSYYKNKHQGRKITWIYAQCRGELTFEPQGDKKSSQKFIFMSNTIQIIVLLSFNRKSVYSVEELSNSTQVDLATISKVLVPLLKARILIQTNKNSQDGAEPQKTDLIEINDKYKNKKRRININVPIKSEQTQESEATIKKVEDDRGITIQAAIVRIMKMRKKLDHNNLLAEVMQQLQSRFKPRVPLIKKQIEILVEKEYLERMSGDRETYQYLA
jgi:cullin 1